MLTSVLLTLAFVVSLVLALLIAPVLLIQRFLAVASSVDEVEEAQADWAASLGDRSRSYAQSMG